MISTEYEIDSERTVKHRQIDLKKYKNLVLWCCQNRRDNEEEKEDGRVCGGAHHDERVD